MKTRSLLNNEISLSKGEYVNWGAIREKVISTIVNEQIDSLWAFGSASKPLEKRMTYPAYKFLGLIPIDAKYEKVYPNDIDVLVLTKKKPLTPFISPEIETECHWYDGYVSGVSRQTRSGLLHITLISTSDFKKAIKNDDQDAIRINKEKIQL